MSPRDNVPHAWIILAIGALATTVYLVLAHLGDLRDRPGLYLGGHGLLLVVMLVGWRLAGACSDWRKPVLVAALAFRLAAVWGEPAMSDDLYRYVWDGRVQLAGLHPYAHAPDADELAGLRDEVWARVNHREIQTIYPPLAEGLFALLAALGAGPVGFKLCFGLLDFAVVLLLPAWLRRSGAPESRVVLYAWNPLAVLETAGSGHLEPVGILLVVLAVGWAAEPRRWKPALALAGAVHAKLLPLALLPGLARRWTATGSAWFVAILAAGFVPYALLGPAIGPGLFAYARRWEHNGSVFPLLRGLIDAIDPTPTLKAWIAAVQGWAGRPEWGLWDWLYRHVWPEELARLGAVLLAAAWIGWVALRRRPADPAREAFLVLAGVLLLSPTVHPWYGLWILPFAVAQGSLPWLAFVALLPLSYLGAAGPLPVWVPLLEYGTLAVLAATPPAWARW